MAALKPTVKKMAMDWLLARLKGDGDLSLPSGMPDFTIDKDRRVDSVPKKTARLSLYSLRQNEPQRTGEVRKPSLLTRTQQIEVRVLLLGDDDDLDSFEQWITYCMATAGQVVIEGYPRGLALSVREAESSNTLLKDSDGNVLVYQSRWTMEYTTLPADLTYTGREEGDAERSQKDRAA